MYYELGPLNIVTDGYISGCRKARSSAVAAGSRRRTGRSSQMSPQSRASWMRSASRRSVNLLLTGHSHWDHSFDTATWSKLTGARIIGSKTTCLQARAEGLPADRCRAVDGGEAIPLAEGVTMWVVRWNHSGDPAANPEQHNPVELDAAPVPDPKTGGLRAGVAEDFPNGGGNRAFLFTVDGPDGRFSWFFNNSASPVDLHVPIVIDAVDYGAPIDNLKARDEGRWSWRRSISGSGRVRLPVAKLVVPVLKPKAFIPVHWDGLWGAFEAGVPKPYADAALEEFLKASRVSVVKPAQYMDKWRLDRKGVRPIANTEVKKALGFN